MIPLVCRHLLGEPGPDLVDLRNHLIIVTTRHAGRRLREGLAAAAREQNRGLLAPQVVQPSFLFRPQQAGAALASDLQLLALLSEQLRDGGEEELKDLLPRMPAERSAVWCHSVASMLLKLRKTLQDHHYSIDQFVARHEDDLVERERWQLLVDLEHGLQERLARVELLDPVQEGLRVAESPVLPPGVSTVILAANPDPADPALHALSKLAEKTDVKVLIHAPEDRAADFDTWGRPAPDAWSQHTLPLPDPARIHVSGSASAQVERVLDTMARLPDRFGPRDISVALPDTRYADRIDIRLREVDIDAFDPSGDALAHHPLFSLLRAFRSFASSDRWSDFRQVAGHEHCLQWMGQDPDFSRMDWLKALDDWQADALPLTFEDWADRLLAHERMQPRSDLLLQAVKGIRKLKQGVLGQPSVLESIQHLCGEIYAHRDVGRSEPDDDSFRQAAEAVNSALQQWSETEVTLPRMEAWGLILRALAQKAVYTDRSENSVALEGWLELHWSPAPVLIITGMHEGHVPDTRMDDMFLPETLRARLGLTHDAERCARDAFLYESAFQSRKANGEVHLVMGRLGPDQEPLKPSRLLLRSESRQEMLERCQVFFGGDVHEVELPDLTRPSMTLDPSLGVVKRDIPGGKKTLSVGGLGSYLKCPFSFYLQNVLRMRAVDSAKSELAATDFGSLIHETLDMFSDPKIRVMDDASALSACLQQELDRQAVERYGTQRPLFLRIQLDAMKQRLHWAAQCETDLRRQGWETVETEMDITAVLSGMELRGRIDRVDRHRESGLYRILDYKTSATASPPQKAHLTTRRDDHADYRMTPDSKKSWQDLQLPLYVWMFRTHTGQDMLLEPSYFNLPKAVKETGVYGWPAFNETWLASAVHCAAGVIADIQAWKFWPPEKDTLQWDLGELFPSSLEQVVDGAAFESFLAEKQRGDGE